ncbi:MAG: hypothetical protein AB2L11_10795 [Syntrophobacteraceae bacterium]
MDEDAIRKLLGSVAGAPAGTKVEKGEAVGGFTGGIAGAIGGLLTGKLFNSVEKLPQATTGERREGNSKRYDTLGDFAGIIAAFLLVPGIIAGLAKEVGLTEERVFEALGVRNEAEAKKLLLSKWSQLNSNRD